jgi:hypothetical protein
MRRERLWANFSPDVPLKTMRQDRPLTVMQALMEDRDDSWEQESALSDAVAAHFDALTEQDRFVLDACVFEGLSLMELGARLGVGKTQAHRLYHAALGRLTHALQHTDLVRERMGMEPLTWDDSAARWVRHYHDRYLRTMWEKRPTFELLRELRDDLWVAAQELEISQVDQLGLFGIVDHMALIAIDILGRDVGDLPDLLVYKQRRYGCDNILRFGYLGIAIRMSDKVERLVVQNARGDIDDEDPALDLVGYAVIAHMVNDGTFTLPLAEDVNPGSES